MRSRWRLSSTAAVMVTGLFTLGALTSASPAFAQGKPPAKPAAPAGKAPAKAAAGALTGGKAPAKPKVLTEKQKKEAARKAYKDGEAKFKDGNYAAALELYKAADELLPVPATKYKIAVCRDKLGLVVEAAGSYQIFLDASPDPAKMADSISDSRARLDALKKTPGRIRVTVEPPNLPGLAFAIDSAPAMQAASLPSEMVSPPAAGAPLGNPPPGAPPPPPVAPGPPVKVTSLTMPPGHHRVTATATGYDPGAAEFDLGFAESRDIKVALSPTPPPPPPPPAPIAAEPVAPPPPPPPPPRSNVPAYVTLGLAGAGVIVGGVFGGLALSAKSDFNKAAAAKPSTATSDMADKVDRNALISDMSFAVALTFGVTGAVLLLSNDTPAAATTTGAHRPAKKTAVHAIVTPYFSPTGGGAAGLLTF
jgi:tetratricopeptide (TPR) repeat protein